MGTVRSGEEQGWVSNAVKKDGSPAEIGMEKKE